MIQEIKDHYFVVAYVSVALVKGKIPLLVWIAVSRINVNHT